MKKIYKLFYAFLALILILTLSAKTQAASQLDQSCSPGVSNSLELAGNVMEQTFKPSLNRLTKVGVYLVRTGSIILRVIAPDNSTLTSTTLSGPGTSEWVYHTFAAKEVSKGQTYRIVLSAGSGVEAEWHYGADSCYALGTGYKNGTALNRDFGFATYGYNEEEKKSGESNQNGGAGQTATDTKTNYGVAPSENIDFNIKPPTEVKAENSPHEGKAAIKISWQKSVTKDIDGYKVFRKEGEKDFSQIVQTTAEISEFTDERVVEGTDYTYMVRAYRGDKESDNSNEAFVTASLKSAERKPVVLAATYLMGWNNPIIFVIALLSVAAVLLFVLFYLRSRHKEKIEKGKGESDINSPLKS